MDKPICNKYKGIISFDNIILRPIGIDDIEIIRTWRNIENNNRLFKNTQYITKESQEKWYANYKDDETDIMFMISYKNILVGTVAIYNIDYQKGIGEFGRILIIQEVRGNGIGLKVTENLCKYVFENLGLNKIKLEVFKDNIRAVNLYKSLGFKAVNTEIYDNREIILMEIYYNK